MGCVRSGLSKINPMHWQSRYHKPRYENLQYMYRDELDEGRITHTALKRYGNHHYVQHSNLRRLAETLKSDSASQDSWCDPAVVPSSPTTTLDRAGVNKLLYFRRAGSPVSI